MNTQKIIEFMNSNMFLVVSYSLIFILLSGYALRFLAKLFMFFIVLGIFVFAMSFMFSNTPGFTIKDLYPDKIIKNFSSSFKEIKSMLGNSEEAIKKFKNMIDMDKINDTLKYTQDTLDSIKKTVTEDIYGPDNENDKPPVQTEPSKKDRESVKPISSYEEAYR